MLLRWQNFWTFSKVWWSWCKIVNWLIILQERTLTTCRKNYPTSCWLFHWQIAWRNWSFWLEQKEVQETTGSLTWRRWSRSWRLHFPLQQRKVQNFLWKYGRNPLCVWFKYASCRIRSYHIKLPFLSSFSPGCSFKSPEHNHPLEDSRILQKPFQMPMHEAILLDSNLKLLQSQL